MNDTTYYVFAIKATRKPTPIFASKDLNACKNVASQHYDVWRTLHTAKLAYSGISFQVFDKPIHETVEIGAGDVKPVYQVGGY